MFLGCHRRAWHVSFPIMGTEAHLLHIHQTSMFHVKHCNLRPCAMFHVKHCDSQTHSKKMRGARQVICRFQSIANLSPKFNPSFKGTRRGGNTPREGSFWIHAANIGVPDAERWRCAERVFPLPRRSATFRYASTTITGYSRLRHTPGPVALEAHAHHRGRLLQ